MVARKLKKLGVEVMTGAKAKSWSEKDGRAAVVVDVGRQRRTLDADKVLVAVGRRPNSEGLGLEEVGVKLERGFIPVDKRLRTNVPGIYAIGDVAGQPMLAHKASREAEVVAEVIAGHKAEFDVRCIPAVIFTDPEVASAGITADEAKQRGRKVKVGKFPFVGARARHRQRRHRRLRQGRRSTRRRRRCWASTSSATAPPTSSPRRRWPSRWARWPTTSA